MSRDPPPPAERIGVLLVNLGTPDAPTAPALRRYLGEFLSDTRVVEIPRLAWWPILHGLILRTRPARSAAKYRQIWLQEGSPLLVYSRMQAAALQAALDPSATRIVVELGMRYGQPALGSVLDALRARGAVRIVVLPLYPQYSGATCGSSFDALARWSQSQRWVPELRQVSGYAQDSGYIAALAASVRAHWQAQGAGDMLVMSFHGMPERTRQLGDPYHDQCQQTARLLAGALDLPPERWRITFQSRFGTARWLEPATEPTLVALAQSGLRAVDVVCPGFAVDCLETLEEINLEARAAFLAAGGARFGYVPCLNAQPQWIAALATLARRHLAGWIDAAAPGTPSTPPP